MFKTGLNTNMSNISTFQNINMRNLVHWWRPGVKMHYWIFHFLNNGVFHSSSSERPFFVRCHRYCLMQFVDVPLCLVFFYILKKKSCCALVTTFVAATLLWATEEVIARADTWLHHRPVASCDAPRSLTQVLPKPDGSTAKTSFSQRKSLQCRSLFFL